MLSQQALDFGRSAPDGVVRQTLIQFEGGHETIVQVATDL